MTSVNVVRVKRKRSDEPIAAIAISSKKSRPNNKTLHQDEPFVDTAKFLGTSDTKHGRVADLIQKAVATGTLEQSEHARARPRTKAVRKSHSHGQQLKVVSRKRGIDLDELGGLGDTEKKSKREDAGSNNDEGTSYNVVDLVRDMESYQTQPASEVLTCNGVALVSHPAVASSGACADAEEQYVYDIYLTRNEQLDFRDLERDLLFECVGNDDIVWQSDSDSDGQEGYLDDEDDENAEDNWRHDYPDEHDMYDYAEHDEEEDDYDYEKQSGQRFTHLFTDTLKITDSDDELSNDSEDEDQVTHDFRSRDAHAALWTPTTSYDAYKRRVMRQIYGQEKEGSDDEDVDDDHGP